MGFQNLSKCTKISLVKSKVYFLKHVKKSCGKLVISFGFYVIHSLKLCS